MRQYEEGRMDESLWTRALAQANGDKEAAVAVYLRARATALRLLNRDLRTERRPPATAAAAPVARRCGRRSRSACERAPRQAARRDAAAGSG